MLAASRPILGPEFVNMGVSQEDRNFDPSSTSIQGVYMTLSVRAGESQEIDNKSGDNVEAVSVDSCASDDSSSEEVENLEDKPTQEDQNPKAPTSESSTPCVRPKYGTTLVGLPDKFLKEVEALEKKKEKPKKKKKWRCVSAEDMGFRLTLFPRETVTCDVNVVQREQVIFEAIETEIDSMNDKLKPFRHLLQLEGKGMIREERSMRRDRDRRVQKAHKQVKSKDITSVLNNKGRKTLYIHFRLYKLHPFLHCSNLEHPNLPPLRPLRSGVCLDVARSAIKAQVRAEQQQNTPRSHHRPAPPQNLAHALDSRNAASELPTDVISFLINLQHREMTPEDYDMLLRLDEGIAPKTMDQDVISAFKTDVVDESSAGDVCSVCMEAYELGEARKFLPCDHVFHVHCIDMWLSNSSQNCPLDGIPVGFS